ncbi:MAG: flavodoxin family protein [Planctomycetota bacterium]|jgi:multimeric flavodoxin WrbA
MRVVTVLGSPRKNGNTAKVLGVFEGLIADAHEVDRVNVAACEIKGCLGCRTCQNTPTEPGCVQKDDAVSIFRRMMNADVVLYATPLYCWCFPSQMKALIDRSFCLATGYGTPDYQSLLKGKRTALLVTCGGPVEDNADLIKVVFSRMNSYVQCKVVGSYIVPFCTTPDAIGSQAEAIVKKMAGDIVGVG